MSKLKLSIKVGEKLQLHTCACKINFLIEGLKYSKQNIFLSTKKAVNSIINKKKKKQVAKWMFLNPADFHGNCQKKESTNVTKRDRNNKFYMFETKQKTNKKLRKDLN